MSYDSAGNANGDRISDYTTLGHFRHELYRVGSMIFCGMPVGMITNKPTLDFKNLTVA